MLIPRKLAQNAPVFLSLLCQAQDLGDLDTLRQETLHLRTRERAGPNNQPKLSYNQLVGIRFGTHSWHILIYLPAGLPAYPDTICGVRLRLGNPMTPRHTQLIANWIMSWSSGRCQKSREEFQRA